MNPFELVETFNYDVVGIPKREWPHRLVVSEYDWFRGVIVEELDEFIDAYWHDRPIDQVDAIIDLIYFAMGGLVRLGIKPEQALDIFYSVHFKNMLKHGGNKGRGSDLDAVKPEGWQGPEEVIKSILEK